MVEVTLILPLLLVLVGAAVDWGLLFFVSHVVQNAVREGARAAVAQCSGSPCSVGSSNILNTVNSVIPDTPLFSSFRGSSHILVTCDASGPFIKVQSGVDGSGNPNGVYNFIFLRLLGFTSVSMARTESMRYERSDSCPTIT